MKFLITCALLVISIKAASGQNLIGYDYDYIVKFMKENRKDLNMNKVNNSRFKYLKYTDDSENQTVLFFLGADSVCRSIRMICDESAKNQRIREFNSIYRKRGENRWVDTRQGVNYLIELKDEDWASVITMLPVNKN
jgi:hypothetical protein